MKLIPKYNNGKPITYYTDADPNYQGKYTDSKGNKSVSAKYIYVDENGTPILTKDLDKYDTSNPKYLKKKVLPEVKIEETKTRTFPEWFNDEIMLNKDNIRVKNYRKAETRNPNFSQDWDMLGNIYDFTNIATAGAINRFSPTQNIRLAIDAIKGNNIADSWMGNNGIVTDRFAENHPYWSMAINGVGDASWYYKFSNLTPKRLVKKTSSLKKEIKPYIKAYKNRNNKYISNYELRKNFDKIARNEKDLDLFYRNASGLDKEDMKTPLFVMQKDNTQFVVRNNPGKTVGAEIHLGGNNGTKPSTVGQRFAFRMMNYLPSGSYISSNSYNPSLNGIVQEKGFWKTLFSKDYNPLTERGVTAYTIPLTENSYELLLNTAKRNPSKFRLDFAHNYRGKLYTDPASVDKNKQFYQLYHEAINTKNLIKLNNYLKSMNAPKASFDELGDIELSMPILYKKRFGGKLIE